jgi:hypothetical protein
MTKQINTMQEEENFEIDLKLRKSALLEVGLLTTGFAGLGLTAAAIVTTLVSFIKEAKDWLIEKANFVKPFFDFLSQHPWLAPIALIISGAISGVASGATLLFDDTRRNTYEEFNARVKKSLPDGMKKEKLLSNSDFYKSTHYVNITRKNDSNDKVQVIE